MSAPAATIERLIAGVAASINVRTLYPPQHPRVGEAVRRVIDATSEACREGRQDAVTFLRVGDDLVVDDRPLRQASVFQQQFVVTLGRLGIEALTLAHGLDAEEYHSFIATVAASKAPTSSAHILIGRVRVAVAGSQDDAASCADDGAARQLSPEQLDAAREAFVHVRADVRSGLGYVDEVVWGLMGSLSSATRTALPLAPLKVHDEYTFVHSVNVSLLTLAQARSFGIEGAMLHAIGVASMLHDIGKVRVPLEVLNKPGRLESEEWRMMMRHAELGAEHLASLESAAPLSIIVAYEHHLRWDGQPNYPILTTPRRPALASQMTALADTYDAMCTARSYKKAVTRAGALAVLRERGGTFLDPFLVASFYRVLGAEPPSA